MLSLGILMPFFFLISNILGNVVGDEEDRPLPAGPGRQQDHAGGRRRSTTTRPYGPWGGLGIMVLWVVAALLGGYAACCKQRDA